MKLVNRVGGGFLLAILAIVTISGFQSPTGRPIWNNLWAATAAVLVYFRLITDEGVGPVGASVPW